MKKSCILLVYSFLVISCATNRQNNHSTASADLNILVTNNRQLELEPCGCTLSQRGGVDREWTYLKSLRSENVAPLFFAAGSTFTPEKAFKTQDKAQYQIKANYLMKALVIEGVTAIAPSARDMQMGKEMLAQLSQEHHVPFVLSNVVNPKTNTSPFAPYLEMEKQGVSLLILGVTSPDGAKLKNWKVLSPSKAIRKIIASLPKKDRLVIVLSSLRDNEREDLMNTLPEINLVLGGATSEYPGKADQVSTTQMHFNPDGEGRALYRFSVTPRLPISRIYNPVMAKGYSYIKPSWERRLNEISRQISSKGSKDLSLEKQKIEKQLERTRGIELAPDAKTTQVGYELVEIGPDFDAKDSANPMPKLVADMKEAIRQQSLE